VRDAGARRWCEWLNVLADWLYRQRFPGMMLCGMNERGGTLAVSTEALDLPGRLKNVYTGSGV
jgi:hypothetical protein